MSSATPTIYEPDVGMHITHAVDQALALATRLRSPVTFSFNDIPVTVQLGDMRETILKNWEQAFQQRIVAYRQSEAGRQAARDAEIRRLRAQAATDELMAQLPDCLNSLESAVRWCAKLSNAADHVGVYWEPGVAADALEMAGYKLNAHVGESRETLEASRQLLGEYLIGQAISCLRGGMPPHPVIATFAERAGFI